MEMKQIRELIKELHKAELTKLVYKKGDLEIHLEKQGVFQPSVQMPNLPSMKQEKETKVEPSGVFITSPMVGTFYSSPAPDQPPFIKMGDRVSKGSVVCIIEAMKVMNEVKADANGIIEEVLIHNGQPVEFGTRLFRIVAS